jgi:hypothetical protein
MNRLRFGRLGTQFVTRISEPGFDVDTAPLSRLRFSELMLTLQLVAHGVGQLQTVNATYSELTVTFPTQPARPFVLVGFRLVTSSPVTTQTQFMQGGTTGRRDLRCDIGLSSFTAWTGSFAPDRFHYRVFGARL